MPHTRDTTCQLYHYMYEARTRVLARVHVAVASVETGEAHRSDTMASAPDSTPLEYASFIGFHYNGIGTDLFDSPAQPPEHACDQHICSLVSWARQTRRVAARVARAVGRETSVHLYTRCIPSEAGDALGATTNRNGGWSPSVVIHAHHDPRFVAVLQRISHFVSNASFFKTDGGHVPHGRRSWPPQWHSGYLLNLLRWTVVRCTYAELVVSLDIDTDPFPLLARSPSATAAMTNKQQQVEDDWGDHWVALLRCAADQRDFSMFSHYDGSAAVNTGFLIIKPNKTLYEEGLRVLQRAELYNHTHGWDAVGHPRSVTPHSDHAWTVLEKKNIEQYTKDDWTFASAETDQGFFWYLYRVRHRRGADLRVLTACKKSNLLGRRRTPASLGHYCGGIKPEKLLNHQLCQFGTWPALLRSLCPFCKRNASDRPERSAWEVARAISWGQRTQLEVARLRRAIRRSVNASDDEARLRLPRCSTWLDASLKCAEVGVSRWTVEVTDPIRRMHVRAKLPPPLGARMSAVDFLRVRYLKAGLDGARPKAPAIS